MHKSQMSTAANSPSPCAVVMIGVMGRLLSDYGLQFAENFVYQSETPIFPSKSQPAQQQAMSIPL